MRKFPSPPTTHGKKFPACTRVQPSLFWAVSFSNIQGVFGLLKRGSSRAILFTDPGESRQCITQTTKSFLKTGSKESMIHTDSTDRLHVFRPLGEKRQGKAIERSGSHSRTSRIIRMEWSPLLLSGWYWKVLLQTLKHTHLCLLSRQLVYFRSCPDGFKSTSRWWFLKWTEVVLFCPWGWWTTTPVLHHLAPPLHHILQCGSFATEFPA